MKALGKLSGVFARRGAMSSPPVDEAAAESAALERMASEARRACLVECERHVDFFLADYSRSEGPPPTYEDWIACLHPENLTAGVAVDTRFYIEASHHRQLWNRRCAANRRVEPRDPPPQKSSSSPPADAAAAAKLRQLDELKALEAQLRHLVNLHEDQAAQAKRDELLRLRQLQIHLQRAVEQQPHQHQHQQHQRTTPQPPRPTASPQPFDHAPQWPQHHHHAPPPSSSSSSQWPHHAPTNSPIMAPTVARAQMQPTLVSPQLHPTTGGPPYYYHHRPPHHRGSPAVEDPFAGV